MPQETILNNFKKYIDLSHEQSHGNILADLEKATLENNQDKINQLENLIEVIAEDCRKLQAVLDKGHCFGLSSIHGAMDEAGKLAWWESALVAVTNWDGKEESLDQVIILTPQTAPIKLKTLFERVVSYVTSNQTDYNEGFKIENLNQYNLLSPEGHYFEILDNKEIKQIKQRKITGGYLTSDQLLKLLKENDFTQTISLIHAPAHTIRVYYKEGKWVVYDPNYDHTSLETIHKEFDNKEDLAEEIFRILGHSITIEIATCNPSKVIELPTINSLDPEDIVERLKELGLHMITPYYTAHDLSEILTLAGQAKNGATCIAQALAKQDPSDGETGLHVMMYYAPEILSQALMLVSKANDGSVLIAKALVAQDEEGWTGLQMIVRYAPDLLPQVLTLVSQAENGAACIAQVLTAKDNEGWTGLQTIASYAPDVLSQALTLASEAEGGSLVIAEALAAQNEAGWSGLQMITYHAPDLLPLAVELASQAEDGPFYIAEALVAQNKEGWTGLRMMIRYASDLLPQAIELVSQLAANTEYGAVPVAQVLAARDQAGQTGLSIVAQSMPDILPQVLTLVSHAKDGATFIAKALAAQDQAGQTGLQTIEQHAPQTLELIQELFGIPVLEQDQEISNAANDAHYQGSANGLFSPAGKNLNSTHVRESLGMNSERRFKMGS